MKMIWRITMAAGLLTLAACSGNNGSVAPTAAPPITDAPLPTLAASVTSVASSPDTTTAPATSEVVDTTTAPATTEAVDTTTAPTTTAEPPAVDDQTQAVIDAFYKSWNAFNEAKLDPTNDELRAEVEATHTGESLERTIEVLDEYERLNYASRTHDKYPAFAQADPDSVLINGDKAIVDYCYLNSNILVDVGAGPNGEDTLVDESITLFLAERTMLFLNGTWLTSDGEQLQAFSGTTACPE